MPRARATNIGKYTVKAAAARAGVTSNQLRLWERRFKLIDPKRGENGYRVYSDDDILILRYFAQESAHGALMSELAEMPRTKLLQLARTMEQPARKGAPKVAETGSDVTVIEDIALAPCVQALIDTDVAQFERELQNLTGTRGVRQAIREVYFPLLAALGAKLMAGEGTIASEHLASQVVRRKLHHHLDLLSPPAGPRPVLLAAMSDDFHDIGLLAAAIELALSGAPLLMLGPHTPIDELTTVANHGQARAVLVTSQAERPNLTADLEQVQRRLSASVRLAVAGHEALRQLDAIESSGIVVLKDFSDIQGWYQDLPN